MRPGREKSLLETLTQNNGNEEWTCELKMDQTPLKLTALCRHK